MTALATVFALHWAVLLSPGANTLLVAQLAASSQPRIAAAACLGITTVTLMWAVLAALGLQAVLNAHPVLRVAMQVAGGCYLLWLASKMWRSAAKGAKPADGAVGLRMSTWQAVRTGFVTNLLNPKTALFFGSVFATALPAQPPPMLLAQAVAMVWANAVLWHMALALAFSRPSVQRGYARQGHLLSRLAAVALGGFGAKLLANALFSPGLSKP